MNHSVVRRTLALVAVLVVALPLVAGCSGSDASSDEGSAAEAVSLPVAADASPVKGDAGGDAASDAKPIVPSDCSKERAALNAAIAAVNAATDALNACGRTKPRSQCQAEIDAYNTAVDAYNAAAAAYNACNHLRYQDAAVSTPSGS